MTIHTKAAIRFLVQEMARDRSMLAAAILLVVALLLGVGNGIATLEAQRAGIAEALARTEASVAAARAKAGPILAGEVPKPGYWQDPTDVRGFGYYLLVTHAVKPPTALSALTIGSSDVLPDLLRVTPGTLATTASSYDVENPGRLSLGRLDASFVIIFLLPLVIAAVGHGALAIDREAGRLPLLAMHGIDPRRIALLRLGVRTALLGVLALVAILVPLAIAGTAFDAGLLAWLAVALSYGALWVAITLLVITVARRAATAAAALGAVWLLLVLVLPWCIALVAELSYPAPSRVAQVLEGRDATDEAQASKSELLGKFLQDHPEMGVDSAKLDPADFMTGQIAATRMVDARQAESDARFDTSMNARQGLVDGLAWLSPPLLAQGAMVELTGTGLTRHRAFVTQTRAYVDELRRYFEPRVLSADRSFADWDGWPHFQWREPASDRAITAALIRTAGLLLIAGLLAVIAFARLGRISSLSRTEA